MNGSEAKTTAWGSLHTYSTLFVDVPHNKSWGTLVVGASAASEFDVRPRD